MRSLALLIAAFFTAAFATPLLSGSGDLPNPDSFVPATANFLADTLQTPATQSLGPDQASSSEDQAFSATDNEATVGTKLDINNVLGNPMIQVASTTASSPDTNTDLFDASNSDQFKFATSLNLPPSSPTSSNIDESKPNLAPVDGDSSNTASNSETPCVDSGTGSVSRVRRGWLNWGEDQPSGGGSCSVDHAPLTAPPTTPQSPPPSPPSTPGVPLLPKPELPVGRPLPSPKKSLPDVPGRTPDQIEDHWHNDRVNGGPGLGGEQSCDGKFDMDKIYMVVCLGPPSYWTVTSYIAKEVLNCGRCTCIAHFSFSAAIRRIIKYTPPPFLSPALRK